MGRNDESKSRSLSSENNKTRHEPSKELKDRSQPPKRYRSTSSSSGRSHSPKRRKHTSSKKCKARSKKKKQLSSTSSSSSSSSDSSSESSDKSSKRKRRFRKKRRKEKLKEKRCKRKKLMREENVDQLLADNLRVVAPEEDRSRAMAPMTREEWEKRQAVVRKVYDEATGRHRLVKGDGEIVEEIVSRDRHRDINRQATRADCNYFQAKLGANKPCK